MRAVILSFETLTIVPSCEVKDLEHPHSSFSNALGEQTVDAGATESVERALRPTPNIYPRDSAHFLLFSGCRFSE